MGNPVEGVSQTPMSFPTPDTHGNSPDTDIYHVYDVVPGVSPRGTGGLLVYRVASVVVGAPKE